MARESLVPLPPGALAPIQKGKPRHRGALWGKAGPEQGKEGTQRSGLPFPRPPGSDHCPPREPRHPGPAAVFHLYLLIKWV